MATKRKRKIDLGNFEGTYIARWAILICSLLFPFGGFLERLSWHGGPLRFTICEAVPLDQMSIYFFVCIVVLWAWPLFFQRLNSALYMMMFPLLGTFFVGLWFLVIPHALLLCPPEPMFESIYFKLDMYFITICVISYLTFMRKYNRRGMTNNPEVWDFESMKYSPSKPVKFKSEEDAKLFNKFSRSYVSWSVSMAIITSSSGWFFFKYDGAAFFTEDMIIVISSYICAYVFIGLLGAGQLDAIWVVLKESIKQKRKMTIREFD